MATKERHRIAFIVGNTVTGSCDRTADRQMLCDTGAGVEAVPNTYFITSGTLSSSGINMAYWSKEKWQGILSRTVRMLALGPFGSHFFSASATVGGKWHLIVVFIAKNDARDTLLQRPLSGERKQDSPTGA
ncbi:hypothetical protein KIN20_020051 [Parelaphostrongylus tenuis]|uniref:Uncharacterized protein n=1 Tax=Parelaphostrongylus tenuis TaxID=148309 RepID=A0AAD5QQJ8_PARTN|nr:hypothetical protein KIN20_020051 [Parelaphostrongylus tenuis]